MSRLPEIDSTQLSPEQHEIYDRMMRERGHMRGPFAVWLRNAELCQNTLKLQEMFASRVKLERRLLELMIDTGSSLGLLLKTTNISEFKGHRNEKILGIGLNGPVSGYETVSNKLVLTGLEIEAVPTGIVSSEWHNNASIGMDILKDYIVILNYCKAYACFKHKDA